MLPVAVTEETFRHNGIISAQDAQELPVAKLREIFGADAALYLDVRQYGSVYAVLKSETKVTLTARLVDLRTGDQLWSGEATDVDAVIEAKGLKQMNDSGALEKIVDEVIAANPGNVEQFRAGKEKAFNALVGQIMKASKGKANPQQATDLLRARLGG